MVVSTKKIDHIDAIIIKELLKDGRRNFTEIAKECKLSKSIIQKRYRILKNSGIIVGATVQLDYSSFGYNAVGNILFKVEPQQADQIVEYVQKMPNIHAAWRTARTSEINAVVTMESLAKLADIKECIRKIPSVLELRTYIWTGIRNIRENLSIAPLQMPNKMNTTNGYVTNKSRITGSKTDQTDKRIIEKLAVNGRISFRNWRKNWRFQQIQSQEDMKN
jgi:DNA-binding Lrp family transcriptional regulator